ncbi:preprotein translocase subunit SecB [Acidiferrobacter thiooxydans]|uniref:Preprotein translocase subunit SecB n=1 Tax=Acidiferrobacter thiooxydans TaxID=163359 RepID=A0A368HIA7_9GAMM|nr:preprotein translocase subunit SecB [Acidiferrobacter thiooxydans]RCN59121.1 preprotein translocase subunit SecB [Acidiferrobacter thiooxydans]
MSNALLQEAIRCLAIQDVYLRGYNLTIAPDYDPKLNPGTLGVQLRAHVPSGHIVSLRNNEAPEEASTRLLRIYVDTGLRFVSTTNVNQLPGDGDTATPDAVKAELAAQFVAEYLITCQNLSEEARNVFAEHNAAFHVWPYWRELIESVCARARLPLVVLPMFAQNALNKAGQTDSQKA